MNTKLQRLVGRTLETLFRPASFKIVAVDEKYVTVVPLSRSQAKREILCERIEQIAAARLERDELLKGIRDRWDTRNASYIAAIAFHISSQS
jgi:hypothetical protein